MPKASATLLGLIGTHISYSKSPAYFNQKCKQLGLPFHYQLCDCADLTEVLAYLQNSQYIGFNVTIPFKQQLFNCIERSTETAHAVGAINVLRRMDSGGWEGHNTDVLGFEQALRQQLSHWPDVAVICGTGGAARAVGYVLAQYGIPHVYASRTPERLDEVDYTSLHTTLWPARCLWVQATPLGSAHAPAQCPDLPFDQMQVGHTAIDLVYEPEQTVFLQRAQAQGAATFNGLAMLHAQAEAAWTLWQDSLFL